ncbi:MAG: hypothetical protein ACLT2T_11125 [Bilophila wadsworthia]
MQPGDRVLSIDGKPSKTGTPSRKASEPETANR